MLYANKQSSLNHKHSGLYKLPIRSKVIVIIAGEVTENLDIVLHYRSSILHTILLVQRSYDALQYTLYFFVRQ